MLIIEIAVGVFLGGVGLWMFVSYREKKKQAEHNREQESSAFNAAERYVTQRFKTLSVERLDEFRARLATIFDDSSRTAMESASSEWELSRKHLENAKKQVVTEAREALKEYFSSAKNAKSQEKLNQHVEHLISDSFNSVSNELMLIYTSELLSFNDDDLPSVTKRHPRKLFNLGNAHRLGENVEQDYEKAKRLLYLSANQGYEHAQEVLGEMYFYGEGVTQDYQEAMRWFLLASSQDGIAQYHLGLMYDNGYGVKQDYEEALKWYHLSALRGLPGALTNLGVMYLNGEGTGQDYVLARVLFNLAAARGDSSAQGNLDNMNNLLTPDQIAEVNELVKEREIIVSAAFGDANKALPKLTKVRETQAP